MEEVRCSSPLSSTIQALVSRAFVMLEALWLVGLTSAYQCASALVVGLKLTEVVDSLGLPI
jgi:hypothetical protein